MRPLLLDLFCGAGGAAVGYHRAGFDVIGIDLEPQPHYPYPFIQADALNPPVNLTAFDVIHASPPCQGYSNMSNRWGSDTPKLIAATRDMLRRTGRPYVIENVIGARSAMHHPVMLTGPMFGLTIERPRLFESNHLILRPTPPPRTRTTVGVYGRLDGRRLATHTDGTILRAAATLEQAHDAMGMDWADWHGTKEAIPPAYTEHIGRQLL